MSLLKPTDLAEAAKPLAAASTLPPPAYTSPELFQLEREHIFERDWICVARTDQLPNPGDYRCVDLVDQPIVLTRDQHGEIHAFSRVCAHRAMPIADGCGNARTLTCPYHLWSYNLDGSLRGAPLMDGLDGFSPKEIQLPKLAVETWQGFVLVSRSPNTKSLGPQLTQLDALLDGYTFADLTIIGSADYDSPWNWKILVENFMEAYHHIGPHDTSFEPVYAAKDSWVEDNNGAPFAFLHMPMRAELPTPDDCVFPRLEEARRRELFAATVFPTLLFAASPQGGVWYQLKPTAHNQMTLTIHLLAPSAIAETLSEEDRAGIVAGVQAIHDEDITVNRGPWQGLQAPMTQPGRLSRLEKAIWQLNQYWLDRLGLRSAS